MKLLFLALAVLLIGEISLLTESFGHQLISLKRPPVSVPLAPLAPIHSPRSRYTAKPGDVVVHFDQNHEIQQLQYVLRDGRLASLFKRRPDQVISRAPIQVSSTQRSDAYTNSGTGDTDNSIEIIDSNSREVSRLIGQDHITLMLPEGNTKSAVIETLSGGLDGQGLNVDQLIDNKMDILATVAVGNTGPGQIQFPGPKLRGASSVVLEKLKNKVRQKIRELPGLIENKLRAKSSAGQVFLDQAGRKVVIVDDDGSGELPSGEIPSTSYQSTWLRQPIFPSIVSGPTKTEINKANPAPLTTAFSSSSSITSSSASSSASASGSPQPPPAQSPVNSPQQEMSSTLQTN